MRFSEWKRKVMSILVEIAHSHELDVKAKQTLHELISKLNYLRFRDLAGFLAALHNATTDVPSLSPFVAEWARKAREIYSED